MAREHYNAVRKSNLYEYGGISKPLLKDIAGLIIGPPKVGEEPDPEAGWCVARQDALAGMVGCSPDEVSRQVAKFERDGWLTVKRFRNERGYPRCHYAITPEQLRRIQSREMLKDEDGNYIRAKMPKKGRKDKEKSQKNLNRGRATAMQQREHSIKSLSDDLSGSLLTHGQQAIQQFVSKPSDKLSESVVSSIVPTGDVINGCLEPKPRAEERTSTAPEKEGKTKQEPPVATLLSAKSKPVEGSATLLKPEAAAQLKADGCPDEVLFEIGKLKHYCEKLNNTTNISATYKTLVMKMNGTAKKLSAIWIPSEILAAVGDYEGEGSGVDPEME